MKKLIAIILSLLVVFSVSATAFAAPSKDNLITLEQAKEIALADAKLDAKDVKFTKAKLDFDDGRYEYEIDFRTDDNWEYDYTIDAETGKILEADREKDTPDFDDFFENLFENSLHIDFFKLFEAIKSFFAKLFG